MPTDLVDLRKLSQREKLELVGVLWDDLCQSPDEIPLTDSQRAELERRKAAAMADPHAAEPWEAVRERLRRGET